MGFKPPHSELDVVFSSSKNADRKIRENQEAKRAFQRGQAFAQGAKSK